ncbi:MAG: hypothetical protein H7329_02885 [Opitutaceae bacterium]|nr:hypothetical protein [Cytophagales bacterium]
MKRLLYFVFGLLILSCNSNNVKDEENAVNEIKQEGEIKNTSVKVNGITIFRGSTFTQDTNQTTEFSSNQAKEILENLIIKLSTDTVFISDYCSFKIHRSTYSTKLEHEVEGLIVGKYGFNENKVEIISNYNGTNEGCRRPYSNLVRNGENLIYFDGRYFFELSNDRNERSFPYTLLNVSGIPGDIRQEWNIKYLFDGAKEEAYIDFLQRFPFGGENLTQTLVSTDTFNKEKDVKYTVGKGKIEILKNISVGSLHIIFSSKDNKTYIEYFLEFPFAGSDYGG